VTQQWVTSVAANPVDGHLHKALRRILDAEFLLHELSHPRPAPVEEAFEAGCRDTSIGMTEMPAGLHSAATETVVSGRHVI
jgi:hypothetical protein